MGIERRLMSNKLRSKVDAFFDPNANNERVSAAKMLDHEGDLDNQMASMLQPTGNKVDVGRRIIGDSAPNLQGKAY